MVVKDRDIPSRLFQKLQPGQHKFWVIYRKKVN